MSRPGFQKSNGHGPTGAILALLLAGTPAAAQDSGSLALSPFQASLGNAQLSVG